MPQEVTLTFNHEEDEGLNLTGTVNFPNAVNIHGVTSISIRGLGEWRHVPSNIVHVNQGFIEHFGMPEKSKHLSKVGLNWIGLQARYDILLGYALRHGRNGTKRVQDLLTKFFKAIGASSVKFSILDVNAISDDDLDNE